MTQSVQAVEWIGGPDGFLRLIDQTKLPGALEAVDCLNVDQVWEAIKMLRVRGAPAIGIAAAYGVVIGAVTGAKSATSNSDPAVADMLAAARKRLITWPPAVRRRSICFGLWIACAAS
ncbi:MAG: hypothetical protein U0892_03795 [Pirellulales bacterium]